MAYANISKPSLHFNSKLYTGNSSTQSITGVGFQPDLTWIKDRIGSTEVYSHYLFDAVRGATKATIRNVKGRYEATITRANKTVLKDNSLKPFLLMSMKSTTSSWTSSGS